MKKLRIIVTSIIVLAIVGSAFSFKAKVGSFCIVTNSASNPTDCTTFKQNFRITTDMFATSYKYFPAWNGTRAVCTVAQNGLCIATFRLTGD
jgi:hypothetical protein